MEQNKPLTNKDKLDELNKLISDLVKNNFYGSLEIKMEAGNITIVRKTESIKLQ